MSRERKHTVLFDFISHQIFCLFASELYQGIADFVLATFKPAFKKDLKKIAVNAKAIFGLEAHSNFVKVFQKQVMAHQIVSNLEIIRELANPGG